MTSTLRAYHGDQAIKAKYLDRIRLHALQDQIIHGKYWEGGKGCAVGCILVLQELPVHTDCTEAGGSCVFGYPRHIHCND